MLLSYRPKVRKLQGTLQILNHLNIAKVLEMPGISVVGGVRPSVLCECLRYGGGKTFGRIARSGSVWTVCPRRKVQPSPAHAIIHDGLRCYLRNAILAANQMLGGSAFPNINDQFAKVRFAEVMRAM